jgi:hypothetical protein
MAFEVGADPAADPGPGLAAPSEIEDETGIANRIPAEAGGGRAASLQIGLDAPEQLHLSISFRINFVPAMFTIGGDFLLV